MPDLVIGRHRHLALQRTSWARERLNAMSIVPMRDRRNHMQSGWRNDVTAPVCNDDRRQEDRSCAIVPRSLSCCESARSRWGGQRSGSTNWLVVLRLRSAGLAAHALYLLLTCAYGSARWLLWLHLAGSDHGHLNAEIVLNVRDAASACVMEHPRIVDERDRAQEQRCAQIPQDASRSVRVELAPRAPSGSHHSRRHRSARHPGGGMSSVSEKLLEDEISAHLVAAGGYQECKVGTEPEWRPDFNPAVGLDTVELFRFIELTQGPEWEKLVKAHGGDEELAYQKFTQRLAQQIDERGTVDVLRHGIRDQNVEIRLSYRKPAFGVAPELVAHYDANRLTVTRQLPFDPDSNKTLDLCLFLNGIPVATAELKNHLTGQNIEHAIEQYRTDRDPKNVTLGRRAIVHFAVDPDSVAMTTKLEGKATRFLPFNLGHNLGKGNPPNPEGHKTSYLWERVWARDPWLDILHRFIHVERPEKGSVSARRAAEKVIFPRYHQWDAVLKMEADAAAKGAGHSYLIQHSAGSGKSNTIAWTAHRLSTLHTADDRKVFDKVVVITDRVILDRQLQDTIYQFEHARGVVVKIDEDSSAARRGAGRRAGAHHHHDPAEVPFRARQSRSPAGSQLRGHHRRGALLADGRGRQRPAAGPRSRGGAGADRRRGRGLRAPGRGDRPGRGGARQVRRRAQRPPVQPLLLRLHRHPEGAHAGDVRHAQSRRPGSTSPSTSTRCARRSKRASSWTCSPTTRPTRPSGRSRRRPRTTPSTTPRKARRAIARFVSLHPHHLAQKAEIIVEHFRQHTAKEMGGLAKAMVVTSSRLHAVRYKQNIDKYIKAQGYTDIKTLVAFSGKIDDGTGKPLTEANMNGFPGIADRRGIRRPRLRRADRRREVPDRLRPAAPAHDVRRQDPGRPCGGPDPLAPQPHPPAEGEHLRPRLPQRDRRDR